MSAVRLQFVNDAISIIQVLWDACPETLTLPLKALKRSVWALKEPVEVDDLVNCFEACWQQINLADKLEMLAAFKKKDLGWTMRYLEVKFLQKILHDLYADHHPAFNEVFKRLAQINVEYAVETGGAILILNKDKEDNRLYEVVFDWMAKQDSKMAFNACCLVLDGPNDKLALVMLLYNRRSFAESDNKKLATLLMDKELNITFDVWPREHPLNLFFANNGRLKMAMYLHNEARTSDSDAEYLALLNKVLSGKSIASAACDMQDWFPKVLACYPYLILFEAVYGHPGLEVYYLSSGYLSSDKNPYSILREVEKSQILVDGGGGHITCTPFVKRLMISLTLPSAENNERLEVTKNSLFKRVKLSAADCEVASKNMRF